MPKNKFQDVIYTIIMASVMVYGMVASQHRAEHRFHAELGISRSVPRVADHDCYRNSARAGVCRQAGDEGCIPSCQSARSQPDQHYACYLGRIRMADVPVHELLCHPAVQGQP